MEKRTSLILMFLSSILFMAAAGSGAVLNVPADYPIIQAAVDAAGAGDAVIIAPGTYTGAGNRDIDPNGKAVTIRSTDPNDPDIVAATIIDCNGSEAEPHRGFYFHSGEDANTILSGLTITNGYAPSWYDGTSYIRCGGAIFCEYSSPTITNCTFTGNMAGNENSEVGSGGAIYNYGSSPAITNCTFSSNSTEGWNGSRGGAMCNWNYSEPAITNCTFSGNLAKGWPGDKGGAMYNNASSPTITNCTFSGNSAGRHGGAMYNGKSNPAIINCTFSGNSAQMGGAMYNYYYSSPVITNCIFSGNLANSGGAIRNFNHDYSITSNSVITNCTFTGNSAVGTGSTYMGGGAISNLRSNSVVTNCTFSGNLAFFAGGAIYNIESNSEVTNCTFSSNVAAVSWSAGAIDNDDSSSTVTNSILWGNKPFQISGGLVTYSNVQGGWEGEGNIDEEPNFVSDTDLHLAPASPCIDAGDPNYIPGPNETDLDGNPRVAGARIDMGAYEYPAVPCISVQERRITFIKDRPGGLEKTLQIRNCGAGELKWKITEDCPWLAVSPKKGTSSGEVDEVTLTADAGGLSVGDYRCRITITGSNASNSPVAVDVVLHIGSIVHVPAGYSTIQEAIDAAGDGDTVLVADGVYKGDGNRDIDFRGKKIWLKSENGAENCIIDCNGSGPYQQHRGFYFHGGEDTDSIVDGLTITNGYAEEGGGIYCLGSSPAITNCTFTDNSAEGAWPWRGGGALANAGGEPAITNCSFSGNSAGWYGGAIYNCYGGSPAITSCTFTDNSAERDGGAIYNGGGSNSVITNCTFSDNSADSRGGAICNYNDYYGNTCNSVITSCTFTSNSAGDFGGAICNYNDYYDSTCNSVITNCTFTGNSARRGGGAMLNFDDNSVITNCTFSGNLAEEGGAMWNQRGNPAISNCTFSGNSAEEGGVMYNLRYSNPVVTNCILWGDGPQEIFNYGDSNSVVTYSDVQGGWAGEGNIDIDPLFVDPCNGDYHLFEDSPCIDAGDPNYVAGPNETDLDGNPRIVNGIIDMGAYELQPLTPAELLQDLTDYLDELSLHKGIASSLQAKLNAALRLLEDGNENNDGAAAGLLEAFINAASAQYGKKIPAAEADVLIEAAQEIIELLSG